MPDAERIIAEIDQLLAKQFELSPAEVTPDSRLREDLDLDSLDAAELLIQIETKYQIRVDEETARGFRTIGDLHRCVVDLCATAQRS